MAAPILRFPTNYIGLSRGFTSSHNGIDLGWNANYGGQNVVLYAPADGKVITVVDGKNNDTSYANWGNYVKIDHGGGWYTLSAHMLKGSIIVRVGQTVRQGEKIGQMNNSGNSFGSHDHFEVYKGGAGTNYRVDPLLYTYAYPDQVVSAATNSAYKIKYYSSVGYVGTPVSRDTTVDQIDIQTDYLRVRTEPSTNATVLGYINKGIYNVLKEQNAGDYAFHEIEPGRWCAFFSDSQSVYPSQNPDKDKLPDGYIFHQYNSAHASESVEAALDFKSKHPGSIAKICADGRYRVYTPGETSASITAGKSMLGPDCDVVIEAR